MNTVLMYIIKSENEIPLQILPNTAYYIIGKEVRIVDNLGQVTTFVIPPKEDPIQVPNEWEIRLGSCEKRLEKIVTHLTSFRGELNDE